MATFKSLAKTLDRFNERLPVKVNKLAQQTASSVLSHVTSAAITKVDTSEAVSNWRVGLGNKDPSTRSPFFEGKNGSTGAASRAEVRLSGKVKIKGKLPGQEVHISNSVDHIHTAVEESIESILAPERQKLLERVQRFKV